MEHVVPTFQAQRRSSVLFLVALLVIVALAAGSRFIQLDAPALWWDEGNNAYFAHRDLARLLDTSRATNDTDPPAHRIMLSLWLRLFGDSAFSLRSLSAVLGVGLVVLVASWGRWLAGPVGGLLAALLVALSPMAVHYSREAKGYPVVAFFGLLAFYLWSRYLNGRRDASPTLWALYVLSGVLALGSHYYAVFLFVPQLIWLLIDLPRARSAADVNRRQLWIPFGANALIGLLVLPWVILTYDSAMSGAMGLEMSRTAYGPLSYLRVTLSEIAAGPNAPLWAGALAVVGLSVAALYGVCHNASRHLAPLVTLVVVSVSLAFLVQLWIPFYSPRFLLYITPVLCLLASVGIVRLRAFGLLPLACVGLAWAVALPTAYAPFTGPEEDLRPLAQVIQDVAEPDDLVLVGYIWQEGILRMYAPGERAYALSWLELDKADGQLRDLATGHPRLWLMTYNVELMHESNPGGWWLEQNAARALLEEHGRNRLVLYLNPFVEQSSTIHEVSFEGGLHLRVTDLVGRASVGQVIGVDLTWLADAPIEEPRHVFLHLIDSTGKVWAQSDGPPINWLRPFSTFVAGQSVVDRRAMLVTSDIPPGRYSVTVGLYNPDTQTRVRLVDGAPGAEEYLVGEMEIVPGAR